MATVPASVENAPENGDDLPLFRFGLRQLLVFMAGISALFAALALTHGATSMLILLAVVIVTAHVSATTLGTRLRARTDKQQVFGSIERFPLHETAENTDLAQRLGAFPAIPRSPWQTRGTTVLPWLRRLVITAIAMGAVVGTIYLAVTIGYRTSPAGVIVGGCSVAVLFGWCAFLGGSFYGVFRHGFRESVAAHRKDLPPDTRA